MHKAKYEFTSRVADEAEPYLVRMEEVGEGSYLVHYGSTLNLQAYPAAGATMMSLEAVQFLGRLWGTGHIPEPLSEEYKAWLTNLERELLNHRGSSA